MVRLGPMDDPRWPFAFAHRAFWAKLIYLRADADNVRLGVVYELPFNLPRTARAASTCFSWLTRLVRSARSSDTIDTSPFRFAIVPPRDDVSRVVWELDGGDSR